MLKFVRGAALFCSLTLMLSPAEAQTSKDTFSSALKKSRQGYLDLVSRFRRELSEKQSLLYLTDWDVRQLEQALEVVMHNPHFNWSTGLKNDIRKAVEVDRTLNIAVKVWQNIPKDQLTVGMREAFVEALANSILFDANRDFVEESRFIDLRCKYSGAKILDAINNDSEKSIQIPASAPVEYWEPIFDLMNHREELVRRRAAEAIRRSFPGRSIHP